MRNELRITLPRALDKGAILINITNDFTGENAQQISVQLDDILSNYHHDCIINIPNQSQIDISGLNALLRINKRQIVNGKKLQVISKSDSPVRQYMEMAGIDRLIDIQSS